MKTRCTQPLRTGAEKYEHKRNKNEHDFILIANFFLQFSSEGAWEEDHKQVGRVLFAGSRPQNELE
jgi:hypothetical protein